MDDISPHMRRIRPLPAAPLQAPLGDNQLSTADLRSIISILLRNLKFILAIPMIASAIAHGILHFVQPQYKSTSEILAIDTKRTNDPASDKHLSVFEVDQAAVASEIAVIMSQSVATRVVKQLAPRRERATRIASLQALITSPSSNTSEAIRTLRTVVALGTEGDVPRVFLVTSSMPSEGKSTLSLTPLPRRAEAA